jgi:hypothetical protein
MVKINTFFAEYWWSGLTSADRQGQNTVKDPILQSLECPVFLKDPIIQSLEYPVFLMDPILQ